MRCMTGSSSSSSIGRSRGRSVGLASKYTMARVAAVATVAAALATTTATTTRAVVSVMINKGRHLALSILQHGTVVILDGDSRLRRPLGLDMVPVSGTGTS